MDFKAVFAKAEGLSAIFKKNQKFSVTAVTSKGTESQSFDTVEAGVQDALHSLADLAGYWVTAASDRDLEINVALKKGSEVENIKLSMPAPEKFLKAQAAVA